MRIRLEPTRIYEPDGHLVEYQHSVQIISPRDDLDIYEVRELLRGALVAWGYAPATVDEIL